MLHCELISTRVLAKVFGALFALVNLTFGWVVGIGTGEQTTGCALESEKQLGVGGFSAETSSPPQMDGVALPAAGSAGGQVLETAAAPSRGGSRSVCRHLRLLPSLLRILAAHFFLPNFGEPHQNLPPPLKHCVISTLCPLWLQSKCTCL